MDTPRNKTRKYDQPTREMMKTWFAKNLPSWDFNLWWTTRKKEAQDEQGKT